MDDNKKAKVTGISIGLVVLIIFLAFGFLIGFTQTKGTKNLNTQPDNGPYADFYFNDSGELVYYSGDDAEVVVPETYSLNSLATAREISDENLNNLTNIADRLGLESYTISAVKTPSMSYYGGTVTTYTLKFRYHSAIVGSDITTQRIGNYAFQENKNITSVQLPETLTEIRSSAFSNCTRLATINLPDNISEIGDYAFQNCDSLTQIELPQSLTLLRNGVFQECSNLETVDMGESLSTIWGQAFYYCRSLKTINFSPCLQHLDGSVFYGCTNLQEVNLPASLYYIANRCFYSCSRLEKVVINSASVINGDSEVFSRSRNLKIYVQDDYVESYKMSWPWSEYSDCIYAISTLQ